MKEIVVVDLDGCFCSVNTFRFWLLFSLLYLFFSFRWLSLYKFNKGILLRFFGKSDRVQMKIDVLRVTERLPQYFIDWFCHFLQLFVNQHVLAEMHKYSEESVVLCTAAPACYVDAFAANFNFSQIFATPSVDEIDWKENIGKVKLETLIAFYGEDVAFGCVITDHHDDLPLLLRAGRRVLVRPSNATLANIANKFEFDRL